MGLLAVLTFLTVAFLWLRGRYRASPLGKFQTDSRRESVVRASDVLIDQGFRIIDERISHELATYYGTRKFTTYVTVDFMAERDGVRYPVKVRSIRDPERISGAWLRKQFYALYSMYGSPVVYVHPDTESIELIDFSVDYPGRYYRARWQSRILWLAIGIVVGWMLSK